MPRKVPAWVYSKEEDTLMCIHLYRHRWSFMSIFRIKVQEPYPQPSGGQKLGVLEVLPDSTVTCMT